MPCGLWLVGIVAAAVPVAPHLLAWVRNKPFDDSAILGFLASVLFITALGYFEFSFIRHPKMTDPYSIRWTKRLGWAIAVGAVVAALNSWVFPKGSQAQHATDAMSYLVLHSWAGYLSLGLVGELWLAYELLSWEAREKAPAPTEGA